MPPKSKGSSKPASQSATKAPPEPAPENVGERSTQRYYQTNPLQKRREEVGLRGLTPAERRTYALANLIIPVYQDKIPFSTKTEREFWKSVTKEALPIRQLPKEYDWGKDRTGRDISSYNFDELAQKSLKESRLAALNILHQQFLLKADQAKCGGTELSEEDIKAEKARRRIMSNLRKELYGEQTGTLAQDPTWDDVVPIPLDEPEGALAKIAYPEDYAEAVSYLRAVMAADEQSPRCLRLTEHVISMNPAHYTVWLYRFKIISQLDLPIPDEITWLNGVALSNLKNYQIWHHRQLLMDQYYPTVADDADAVRRLGKSETDFIAQILASDTKNYHVWSYRQFIVGKLGLWTPAELGAAQNMIEDDVRNNSAWSHRFYVVFSNPKHSTPRAPPTAHDPAVPSEVIDREISYAKEKILVAPQNQSPWNYLRGVLAKGGRGLAPLSEFAEQFVENLGGGDEETVRSSHALDFLADAYKEQGDKTKAKLCLQRLGEHWDPVRQGYWKYRVAELDASS